jgi:hypothetical protein
VDYFARGLHTQQVKRKAESLIKMGYIDEFWRVTEAGKSRLGNEEGQQQHQQTLSEGSLNQPSEAIGRDIPNTAAQAELLRAEQLSLQHNAQLAFYAQLPSNSMRRPGPPVDKPAPPGRISSLKLKLV